MGAVCVAVSKFKIKKDTTIYVYVHFNEWRLNSLDDGGKSYCSCLIESGGDYQLWLTYLRLLDRSMLRDFKLPRPYPLESCFKPSLCKDFISKRIFNSFETQIAYEMAEDQRKRRIILPPKRLPASVKLPPKKPPSSVTLPLN